MSKNVVGHLRRCMYGTRDAGALWEGTYRSQLEAMGFQCGRASPCCFFNEKTGVSIVVHGDDLTALGCKQALDQYEKDLAAAFEIKIRGRLAEPLKTIRRSASLIVLSVSRTRGSNMKPTPGTPNS